MVSFHVAETRTKMMMMMGSTILALKQCSVYGRLAWTHGMEQGLG